MGKRWGRSEEGSAEEMRDGKKFTKEASQRKVKGKSSWGSGLASGGNFGNAPDTVRRRRPKAKSVGSLAGGSVDPLTSPLSPLPCAGVRPGACSVPTCWIRAW